MASFHGTDVSQPFQACGTLQRRQYFVAHSGDYTAILPIGLAT